MTKPIADRLDEIAQTAPMSAGTRTKLYDLAQEIRELLKGAPAAWLVIRSDGMQFLCGSESAADNQIELLAPAEKVPLYRGAL